LLGHKKLVLSELNYFECIPLALGLIYSTFSLYYRLGDFTIKYKEIKKKYDYS